MIELIPQPKEYCEDAGQSVCLAGRHIAVSLQCDVRIVAAAQELSKDLSRLSGKFVAVYQRPAKPGEIEITLSGGKEDDEAYELIAKQEIVRLSGKGMRGVYYAIVTLRQILDQQNGVTLPAFTLSDRPDFPNRVFYQDISRGRVPHVKTLKRLCDTLSMLKINSLQLYLEDAFPFLELDGKCMRGKRFPLRRSWSWISTAGCILWNWYRLCLVLAICTVCSKAKNISIYVSWKGISRKTCTGLKKWRIIQSIPLIQMHD